MTDPTPSQEQVDGLRPHRCNDQLEAVIQALFTDRSIVRDEWRKFIQCVRQKEDPKKEMD